jgi:hypothetical protein
LRQVVRSPAQPLGRSKTVMSSGEACANSMPDTTAASYCDAWAGTVRRAAVPASWPGFSRAGLSPKKTHQHIATMQYMNMKATLLARTKEARDDRSIVEISNHSNVHTDAARLEMQGLIESSDDNAISVPYEAVEILLPLAQVA